MLPEIRPVERSRSGTSGAARVAVLGGLLLGLTACAGAPPSVAPVQGSVAQRAVPPGNPADPWGPYIREAAERFDVPEAWIRAVMKVESGGRATLNGRPIVSSAGAMGLMQVMPATYEDLRYRYGLGPDPYDPRDNILAGTAYLREMYDQFGSPGFLAAYNCGPGCLGEFLAGDRRSLPAETRRYVAMIAPDIESIHPNRRVSPFAVASVADLARGSAPTPAARAVATATPAPTARPAQWPAQPVTAAPLQVAQASPRAAVPAPAPAPIPNPVPVAVPMEALTSQTLRLPSARTQSASASGWAIQVGAFRTANDGQRALEVAQRTAPDQLNVAKRHIMEISTPAGQFYRARLVGFASSDHALQACRALTSRGTDCMPISPGA